MKVFYFLILFLLGLAAAAKKPHAPLGINVHLVSHTHDDTGWLKTVDQYHYGANNSIQFAGTRYILDSVVQALLKDPRRKFTYVEMAFFHRWWVEQDAATKQDVAMLVQQERLQFVNGGWCMHDEANPHYIDMIDQMTLGHRFLLRDLNAVPLVGWQIDPFGHSNTNAFLTGSKAGFVSQFFGRSDYQDFTNRCVEKSREFTWHPSASNPTSTLLGGILLTNHYGPPNHFHWDVTSPNEQPIQDDPALNDYNVDEKVQLFVDRAIEMSLVTLGKGQMWTMGDDFNYQDANFWFKNLDKLIKYVNLDGRVNASYSTPYLYTVAKLAEGNTFPTQTEDFFPYEDCPHCFWTGYFTSRPALKRYIRDVSAYYNVARQIQSTQGRKSEKVSELADAMGLAQHHDAVAGTAKQHVAFDYAQRLAKGVTLDLVNTLADLGDFVGGSNLSYCPLLNISICPATAGLTASSPAMTVIVWNGMGQDRNNETVFVPIPSKNFTASVPFTIIDSPTPWSNNYNKDPAVQPYLLVATLSLPHVGAGSFQISPGAAPKEQEAPPLRASGVALENQFLAVTFGAADGWISSIANKASNTVLNMTHEWCYYESNTGDIFSGQSSGAYIFRPKTFGICVPIPAQNAPIVVVNSPTVQIVERLVTDWLVERLILTSTDRNIRHEFTIGHVPIDDGVGKEIVSRINSSIASNKVFYTDSNGREMQKRTRDFRTYPFILTEPVAGNYYPINALAFVNDAQTQFSVHVDSSIGGGSITDGSLEVMLHRRILNDDGRGVGEPHNETQFITPYWGNGQYGQHYGAGLIIRGQHRWTIEATPDAMRVNRLLMDRVYFRPQLYFAPKGVDSSTISATESALPPNVQLLTLQTLDDGFLLVRIAHQFAVGEDATMSQPVTVDIASVVSKVTTMQETTITTNQKIGGVKTSNFVVTIDPMDVRTFLLTV